MLTDIPAIGRITVNDLSRVSASMIRRALVDGVTETLMHEHASPIIVEPSGCAIQSITFCVATKATYHRVEEMERMLELYAMLFMMDVTEHFAKEGNCLNFGQLMSSEVFETNVSALRMQGFEVETLYGLDDDTLFDLHRTNKMIVKPCKHLLGRCADEALAVAAVTPANRTFMDRLNMLFVR